MKVKKLFMLFLAATIVISNLLVTSVFAVGSPSISMKLDKSKAKVGEFVTATIEINDFEWFNGYQANIKYDTKVLKPVNPDTGEDLKKSEKPKEGKDLLTQEYTPMSICTNDFDNGSMIIGKSYMDSKSLRENGHEESTGVLVTLWFKVLKEVETRIRFEDCVAMPNADNGTYVFVIIHEVKEGKSEYSPVSLESGSYIVKQPEILNKDIVETPSNTPTSPNVVPSAVNTPEATNAIASVLPTATQTPVTVTESPASAKPASGSSDLAVSVSSDKNIYKEDQTITYTIKYTNRLDKAAADIAIKAEIPKFTSIDNSNGGTVKDNEISWSINSLEPGAVKELSYAVKVGKLDKAEVLAANNVEISSGSSAGSSSINVLLCSDSFEKGFHKSYVNGYEGKLFKPDKEITRAEIAVMLARILNLDTSVGSEQLYSDVPLKHWAAGYINAVTKKGIFTGSNNKFNPSASITRAELATAIFRYLGLKDVTPFEIHFKDTGSHWASKYIEEVYRLKLVSGYKGGSFLPNNKVKRSEAVTMLNKMLYRGPVAGAVSSFKDVPQNHWAVGQIEEAVKDHSYSRNSNSEEVIGN